MRNLIFVPRKLVSFFILLSFSLSGCLSEDNDGETSGNGSGNSDTTQGSVQLDGTNEYFTLSNAWYTGDFSICLWMQPTTVDAGGHTLLSMSNTDKYFYISFDANEIDFYWEDANDTDVNLDGVTTITAGSVYQVCVTVDHNTTTDPATRIFVNGTSIASSNVNTAGIAAALTTLTIGNEPEPSFQVATGNKVNGYNGVLDNIMIWNSSLSTGAISQLYNAGQGFDPTFAFGNYTNTNRLALMHWFQMGDHDSDTLATGSAVINDVQGNENLAPFNFESTDFAEGLW